MATQQTSEKEVTYRCESCNRQMKAPSSKPAPQCCGKPMKKAS
jgi:hypothetical protein